MAKRAQKTDAEYEAEATADIEENTVADNGKMFNGAVDDLHPFVIGLLQELPRAGEAWAAARRKLWMDTATSIFQMMYVEGDKQGQD